MTTRVQDRPRQPQIPPRHLQVKTSHQQFLSQFCARTAASCDDDDDEHYGNACCCRALLCDELWGNSSHALSRDELFGSDGDPAENEAQSEKPSAATWTQELFASDGEPAGSEARSEKPSAQ
mmetsp:Transcript_141984/g.247284  ORF Transcript_141984/g.247284 Transcript_141984/m.247284 type:complete len:122 (-) Transcript_141984:306-671(-)